MPKKFYCYLLVWSATLLLPVLVSCQGSEPLSSASNPSDQQNQQSEIQRVNKLIENTPKQDTVNWTNFNRLRDGMSVSEVEAILESGTKVLDSTRDDGSRFEAYYWKGTADYRSVDVQFTDGKLSHKQQQGLQ